MEGISREIMSFMMSIVSGGIFRLSYQLLSGARDAFRWRRIATEITDLFFWMLAALYVFRRIYQANNGMIRWFFAAGVILGVFFTNILIHGIRGSGKK